MNEAETGQNDFKVLDVDEAFKAPDANDAVTEEDWHPLENTKSYWIQTPTGTDKVWLDRRLYEKVLPLFPDNSFPAEMGSMLMRYARDHGVPRSVSGRLLWKKASGVTKSQVASALLRDILAQYEVSANQKTPA